MPKLSPLNVIPLLPGTNCGQCGEQTCMSFAVKLLDHLIELANIKPSKLLKLLGEMVKLSIIKEKAGRNKGVFFFRKNIQFFDKTAYSVF